MFGLRIACLDNPPPHRSSTLFCVSLRILMRHRELLSLQQYLADIPIEIPKTDDTDLKELVKCANESPKTAEEGRETLKKLEAYMFKARQKETEEQKKTEDTRQTRESRWEKYDKGNMLSKKLHAAFRRLAAPVTTLVDFVSRVLQKGIKVLETTSFLAAELTFQTHYQVAVKAIVLFVTVSLSYWLVPFHATCDLVQDPWTNTPSIKAYESANEISENIAKMFEKIGEYEHEMRTLWKRIRSVPMFRAINRLFISIVAFIAGVSSYMKHNTLCEPALHRLLLNQMATRLIITQPK